MAFVLKFVAGSVSVHMAVICGGNKL